MAIDVYFVADICLNFRTAIWLRDGTREVRPRKIAESYCRGWFSIDFVSTLPVSYQAYLGDDEAPADGLDLAGSLGGGEGPGGNEGEHGGRGAQGRGPIQRGPREVRPGVQPGAGGDEDAELRQGHV